MGPSPTGDGEPRCFSVPSRARPSASMGPSPTGDGEPQKAASPPTCSRSLQWGRRQQATERPVVVLRRNGRKRASMGPSPTGDGETPASLKSAFPPLCFNGAVANRRRRVPSTRPDCCPKRCFNGAVANRRRRGCSGPALPPLPVRASMGPSPTGDGETTTRPSSSYQATLQWGRRQQATERAIGPSGPNVGQCRFNGAVANRRRRGGDSLRVCTDAQPASMGPSPTGDGERRHVRNRAREGCASMGPSPTGDGEIEDRRKSFSFALSLQWGRRQQATESP